ncbi:hypothetical protein [Luteolibacter sp. AS25]|uniref:hypothetical protein n=1 Tax=Luteolibacter sp. AS25 TaxID=3135776 RepID=UPI00398ABF19
MEMMNRIAYFISILTIAFCLSPHDIFAQEMEKTPDLESFEVGDRIWLSTVSGTVTIDPVQQLEAFTPGRISWLVEEGAMVKEDQELFRVNAEAIELSERDLALREKKFKNDVEDLTWAVDEQKQGLRATLKELEDSLLELELSPGEIEALGPDVTRELETEKRRVEKSLQMKRERFESDYFEANLDTEIKELELELDQADFKHREIVQQATVKALSDGMVTITQSDVSGQPPLKVGELTTLGVAECRIQLTEPRSRNAAKEDLMITVQGSDGVLFEGLFEREEPFILGQSSTATMIFRLESDETKPSREALDGEQIVRLYLKLSEPASLIQKEPFLLKHTKEIQELGWKGFLQSMWPDAEVVYIGPRVIAVRRKE